MAIGKISKTVLAIALLMGQVTPPSNNFYEDGDDFNSVSTGFSTGWGWGLNKAHAACDDITDDSEARECEIEHIEVQGEQQDTYVPPIDPFGSNSDEDSGSAGGGSGGGESTPPPETTPVPTDGSTVSDTEAYVGYRSEFHCTSDVNQAHRDCRLVSDGGGVIVAGLCGLLLEPTAILTGICVGMTGFKAKYDANNCDKDQEWALKWCKIYTYPNP
jgi:hypothetical protein